jgi:hypothetical protein
MAFHNLQLSMAGREPWFLGRQAFVRGLSSRAFADLALGAVEQARDVGAMFDPQQNSQNEKQLGPAAFTCPPQNDGGGSACKKCRK